MLKKVLKISAIVFIVLIGSLLAIPYFFKDKINEKIAAAINEKIDAKVSFEDADLSLFKNFPSANVSLNKFVIINKAPFAGDTLVSFNELNLKMSVSQLFKGKDEAVEIAGISSKNGLINIIFNENGVGNYDIALKDNKPAETGKSNPLALKISSYNVENFQFRFTDKASKMKMVLDSINHSGSGDMSKNVVDLDTKSTANLSFEMDKVKYMNNLKITLDAVLGLDLDHQKYTFKENKAKINELPLEFNGFIQMVTGGQLYDLSFKTPTSSFQNFLGLIPAAYASKLDGVKTTGDFSVSGFAKGTKSATTIPKFNIAIASNNGSFQYPNLPKSVKNIIIDTKIINETGLMTDTYVNLDKLSFAIDQDVFSGKANFKNLNTNPLMDATIKGTVNLGSLSQAYPMKMKVPMTGILNADVTTTFDMNSVTNSQYQNIKNTGSMALSGFQYADANGKKMNISKALIQFNPSKINLQQFNATTGKSDIAVTGILENFYGFMFKNQELRGNFNMVSNQIAVSDFMTTAEPEKENTPAKTEAMKIPSFLNCAITAKANTVLYDNLVLKNMSGKMLIKDQTVALQNMSTDIFGGAITFNGAVSTKEKTPTFNMNLGLDKVDIASTFTQLAMLKKIAPIAGIISGKINSTIKLNGNLDAKALTPDLKTLSGDLLGQLLNTTVNANNSTLLSGLSSGIKFFDTKSLNLNDLKGIFTFKDGKVSLKPMDIKYKDIKATIGGTHGFDQSMNYNIKMDVPAKYLGNEIGGLLAKLSPTDAAKIENIPLTALLTGNFTKPIVSTDMKSAVTSLTTQLVKQQKDKLIKQGATALGDLLNKNKKPGDSTKTTIPVTKEDVKNKAKDLLNGLFRK
jgi:AsmA-like C-terminal region